MHPGDRPDVLIEAGEVRVIVELKAQRITNAATAEQLLAYAREMRPGTHLVVVARSTTTEARDKLTAAGIGIIDTNGTIRLNLPGVFIWREGEKQTIVRGPGDGPRLAGKAGLAAQALMREPQRRWTIQEIAKVSRASTALVHRLLVRLEHDELVVAAGAGPHKTRRVVRPGTLLDLWVEEMKDRGVRQVRTYRLARDPVAQITSLSRLLDEAGIEHAVSGAAAAMRMAPFATAVPVTEVWLAEGRELEAAEVVGAEHVTDGHNLILKTARDDVPLAFRHRHAGVWLADALRVYLDVSADPKRGREQAAHLRQEVIGF
jgi:hypothetical protein